MNKNPLIILEMAKEKISDFYINGFRKSYNKVTKGRFENIS